MTQIIRQTNKLKYHTDLKGLVQPFKTEFASLNWLLTNQDYMVLDYKENGVVDQLNFDSDRITFRGQELLEIIVNHEVQFIWGVFCGFKCSIPNLSKEHLPYADCNETIWTDPDKFFMSQSEIEIICFDSSLTIVRFRDKRLEDKFTQYFDEAMKLEKETPANSTLPKAGRTWWQKLSGFK